jgi:hydroxymethylpyrimidine pyrophosphatase-like HAD family hydrolase
VNVQLIAVDMDGTLLDPDDRLTPATIAAVGRARAAGLPVVPVTGRPERLIWDVAAEAGLGPLAVGVNGAVILDLEAGSILERHGFSGPAAVAIVDLLRSGVPGLSLAVDEGDLFAYEPGVLRGLDTPSRQGRVAYDDVREVAGLGCLKLVARVPGMSSLDLAAIVSPLLGATPTDGAAQPRPGGHGPADKVGNGPHPAKNADMDRDSPGDRAEVTASDLAWIDIGPPGLSKATGLDEVCRRLGVHLDDVAAIGDHYNDLPMLRVVGLPVAMGNAIPDVLNIAARVMPSNAEDGVATFISEILDGR